MKNNSLKSEWKKYTILQKICFCLVIIIFNLILIGSIGGLCYLRDYRKIPKASAEEFINGTTDNNVSTCIVSAPFEFHVAGGYVDYPTAEAPSGNYIFQYPLIFSSVSGNNHFVSSFGSSYQQYDLPIVVGHGITIQMYGINVDEFLQFYLVCTSAELINNTFGDLYSVECEYIWGTNKNINYILVSTTGSSLHYEMYPYRAEEFGDYFLNETSRYSARWLYISNPSYDFTQAIKDAKTDGYGTGFDEGEKVGREYGENIGYNKGVNDANKYTFGSLLNAVFYAPLKAFISVFNFEILGVNVLNIVSFLFTILLSIGIIRLVL